MPHPELEGVWVYETPHLVRLPSIVIVYTIDDAAGFVDLWNCFLL
jgi:hypothetical protein